MGGQRSAAHWHERNDKRIDAQIDEDPRGFMQRFHGIPKPGQKISADLASTEYLDRPSKSCQVKRRPPPRVAWHDPPADGFIPGFEVHPQRTNPSLVHAGEPPEV